MNDTELLILLRSSPQEGLAAVIERYSAYVYKIAYNRLCRVCAKEDIEEAVSDIFMKLYTAVMRGEEVRSVCAYLSVIAQRHCTDIYRRQVSREGCVPLGELEDVIPDEGITADSGRLMLMLKKLGEPDTEIFVRRFYLGQPVKHIARDLRMKTDAVYRRISRGLKKLRTMLEEEGL